MVEVTYCGTPLYMAPELKKLERVRDKLAIIDGCKADIYSLGITMLHLIYPNKKLTEKLLDQLSDNIKVKEFIYKDLMNILKDMVVDDPQQRISFDEIL